MATLDRTQEVAGSSRLAPCGQSVQWRGFSRFACGRESRPAPIVDPVFGPISAQRGAPAHEKPHFQAVSPIDRLSSPDE
jgi:hypothetical protein